MPAGCGQQALRHWGGPLRLSDLAGHGSDTRRRGTAPPQFVTGPVVGLCGLWLIPPFRYCASDQVVVKMRASSCTHPPRMRGHKAQSEQGRCWRCQTDLVGLSFLSALLGDMRI